LEQVVVPTSASVFGFDLGACQIWQIGVWGVFDLTDALFLPCGETAIGRGFLGGVVRLVEWVPLGFPCEGNRVLGRWRPCLWAEGVTVSLLAGRENNGGPIHSPLESVC